MYDYSKIKALFIDIDDTLIHYKAGIDANPQDPSGMFAVIRDYAETIQELSPIDIDNRIDKIMREITWWHWSDFLVELNFNAKDFWEYAYHTQKEYLESTGPELVPVLLRLHEEGLMLYITSNNPSSGILHKLRLAGLANVHGTTLFRQLLGCNELHAMKCEEIYWQKALAHTAWAFEDIAIIGDNLCDDLEVPHRVGYQHSFIINRNKKSLSSNSNQVTYVNNFNQIADSLLFA